MKTKLLLISLLCIGLLSCEKDNQRDNESSNNQENVNGSSNESSNNQENVNGEEGENGSSDENDSSYIKNGALPGVFSVSDTKQVKFSQGNLQYQASTDTWRFAEHQYDYIGEDNENISSTYSGWIDLFGWGTGNNPTNVSEYYKDYSTFVDWGVNKISNGGNVSNVWFTLSNDEWKYLLYDRPNASAKQGVAMVNGVNGLVLLPDDWTLPDGAYFTSGFANNSGYEYYETVNTYTISEWEVMEEAGAVFLPAAGYRFGTSAYDVGTYGRYWSSTYDSSKYAYDVYFDSGYLYPSNSSGRYRGRSVRLFSEISSK